MAPLSLYVHIPFCNEICAYCDFPKVLYKQNWAESYLSALFDELESRGVGLVDTIYVGGGTPSCLPLNLLDSLLNKLSSHLNQGGEFSLEGNPESLGEDKILCLARHGVNRVSLGVESSLEKYLHLLGRKHDFPLVKERVAALRKAGINNINLDWMIALPGEKVSNLEEEARNFLSLDVPHLSVYTLILEEGTRFYLQGVKQASQDEEGEQYEWVLSKLRKNGYRRYEVSNFAKPGFQCRHNLTYWRDEEFYGIGMGASGFIDGKRYSNSRSLTSYIKGEGVALPSEESGVEDFLLTTLRLEEGFSLEEYERRFGASFLEGFSIPLEKLKKQGMLFEKEGRILPSDKGIELLDYVLLTLISE